MWENIAKIVGDNPAFTLVITIFGTTTIWLYKEFKEMIDSTTKAKISALNEKIKMLSQLQANIMAMVYGNNYEQFRLKFIEEFGEYNTVLNEDTCQISLDYIRHGDPSYLATLSSFLSAELSKLNKEKMKLSKNKNKDTDIEIYISKLYAPLKPMILIWFLVCYFLLSSAMYVVQHTWYDKLNVVILSLSIFVSVVIISSMMLLVFDKSLPTQGIYKWLLFLCIVAAPLVAVICIEISIISIVIQVVAIASLIKFNRRKQSIIITLD